MTTTTKGTAKGRRTPAEKHEARRAALAESALRTLGELGYAKSSLREIANNSEFTHGVVHYYFQDKLELIVFCVQEYKKTCVHRYDEAIETATTADELLLAFADKLVDTIVEEAPMHRLWYDLRSQAMFEESLREAVQFIDKTLEDMIWRVVTRYAELAERDVALSSSTAYGLLDGLFQQSLLGWLCEQPDVLDELRTRVRGLMPMLLSAPALAS